MSCCHAVATAARHGRRALSLKPSSSSIVQGARRPLFCGCGSSLSSNAPLAAAAPLPASASSTARPRRNASSASGARNSGGNSLAVLALATAASLALAGGCALSPTTLCESKRTENEKNERSSAAGLADETEEGNDPNVTIRDGMDAGSKKPKSPPSDESSRAPAEAGDDGDNDDDDDDPSNDEDTTCSICLINRQGPCRKFWLKFERCMKEHGAEKERAEKEARAVEEEGESEGSTEEDWVEDVGGGEGGEKMPMEDEWDAFMAKSIQPGDDDEDDDDEEDDDEEEEEEDDNDDEASGDEDESTNEDDNDKTPPKKEETSLAERCDRFMIPWIGCIQEHRNVYSLISNAFYQNDYVDPLEDTIPESRRMPFAKTDAVIGEADGYVMKFDGAELDLGNWREHVEADSDNDGNCIFEEEEATPAVVPMEEPHLINAYAKFRLNDPGTGRPIEVAYVKDQRGRLLGFDSFTKRENGGESTDDGLHEKDGASEGETKAAASAPDGECTFHIVPGETTAVAAYAIYRGEKKEDEEGISRREDFLYHTPMVPLPGMHDRKK